MILALVLTEAQLVLNRLQRDCIAAILAAYVSYAGETPAVQIQFPIRSSYEFRYGIKHPLTEMGLI
jgi:hypothetical protein